MSVKSQLRTGRPPHIREAIVAELSKDIIAGKWQPGDRIPTVIELSPIFNVGAPTMHQALKTLMSCGFLEARGCHGTFVTAHPPHLSRYGLIFPGSPYSGWSRLWEALRHTAGMIEHLNENTAPRFPQFFTINQHADSQDYKKLMNDLRIPSLAGLIFANAPWSMGNTPLLTKPGIPRVAISEKPGPVTSLFPVRYPSIPSFYERALDFLVSPEGGRRKRIALLCFALTPDLVTSFTQAVAKRGASTKSYWIQAPPLGQALAIQHAVQCLLQGAPGERPDALLIADDNLTTEATKGLVTTGITVPTNLGVVSFCNFPDPPPAAVPVTRIGFNAEALLKECVECIDCQRRKEEVLPVRHLAATFENEAGPAVWID